MVPKDLRSLAKDLVHKEGNLNFKASSMWYQRFMKRHKFSPRTPNNNCLADIDIDEVVMKDFR